MKSSNIFLYIKRQQRYDYIQHYPCLCSRLQDALYGSSGRRAGVGRGKSSRHPTHANHPPHIFCRFTSRTLISTAIIGSKFHGIRARGSGSGDHRSARLVQSLRLGVKGVSAGPGRAAGFPAGNLSSASLTGYSDRLPVPALLLRAATTSSRPEPVTAVQCAPGGLAAATAALLPRCELSGERWPAMAE